MLWTRHPSRFVLASLAVSLLAASATAAVPSSDELMDKAIKAMGGKAINKIESYMSSAEMTAPMGTMTADVFWVKPKHVLVKRTIPQMGSMESGSDGTIAWQNIPMMGGYSLVEGPQMEEIQQQAMHIRFLKIRELLSDKEYELKGVTEAEFDGVACYGLAFVGKEAEKPSGTVHFDAASGLIRGMHMTVKGQSATITLKDWKRINDVNFFHGVNMTDGVMNMSMTFTKIELNNVDPSLVAIPVQVKALAKAAPKAGEEMKLEDFSAPVQTMINDMIAGLPMDDLAALQAAQAGLSGQAGKVPGEYGKAMKYVLGKIDARITELGG